MAAHFRSQGRRVGRTNPSIVLRITPARPACREQCWQSGGSTAPSCIAYLPCAHVLDELVRVEHVVADLLAPLCMWVKVQTRWL